MKVIGMMVTWNNLEFFKCTIEQALEFCDEVVLVEGCHSQKYPKDSTDGTREYVEKIRNHPKLITADFKTGGRYDKVQLAIRRDFVKMSGFYEPGNWIINWDDDILLFRNDLSKLKEIMNSTDCDSINFRCRHFFYNFRFNLLQWSGIYCHRILKHFKMTGVNSPRYPNNKRFRAFKTSDITGFHYCHVKRPERMNARWVMSIEKGTASSVTRFKDWMSVSWDKDEDIYKNEAIIEKIREGGGLNIYYGNHPEALDDHPWRHINDVRKVE